MVCVATVGKPVGLDSSEEPKGVALSNCASVSCSGSGDEGVGDRMRLAPLTSLIAYDIRLVTAWEIEHASFGSGAFGVVRE
jgi:hypothetical protein